MSLSSAQTFNHTITRTDVYIKLEFPNGELGDQLFNISDTFFRGIDDQFYFFGETLHLLTLDFNLCTNISASDIDDFCDQILTLITIGNAPVSLENNSLISATNSTTTPLSGDAVFTGTYIDVSEYSSFTVIMFQDASGTLNIDYSSNGTDLDQTRALPVPSGGATNSGMILSQFMRFRYTNDSVAQSVFRMQVIFHKIKSKENNYQANTVIFTGDDTNLVRNANITELDIARSLVNNKKTVVISGFNPSVGTSAEDIWFNGGNYNFLTAATTLEVVSNNAADDAAGSGARTIIIRGLDSNWDEQTETVSLVGNGTSSATTNTFIRVNSAEIVTNGTDRGSNFDNIVIQASGGGVIVAVIGGDGTSGSASYGVGVSQLGVYSVPTGKSLFVWAYYTNVIGNNPANIEIFGVFGADTTPSPKLLLFRSNNVSGSFQTAARHFSVVPERSDIWVRGNFTTGNVEAIVVRLDTYVVNNL